MTQQFRTIANAHWLLRKRDYDQERTKRRSPEIAMPIFVQCPCGKNFTVPEEQRGKRFKCYICGGDLVAGSHDESSEAIAAQPSGADPASCLPTASHLADDPAAELGRRRQKLRRFTALVGRLEFGCMLAGAVLCLGALSCVAAQSSLIPADSQGRRI